MSQTNESEALPGEPSGIYYHSILVSEYSIQHVRLMECFHYIHTIQASRRLGCDNRDKLIII